MPKMGDGAAAAVSFSVGVAALTLGDINLALSILATTCAIIIAAPKAWAVLTNHKKTRK